MEDKCKELPDEREIVNINFLLRTENMVSTKVFRWYKVRSNARGSSRR
jgi:hypothetical protein